MTVKKLRSAAAAYGDVKVIEKGVNVIVAVCLTVCRNNEGPAQD